MKRNGIYDNWRTRRNIHKYNIIRNNEYSQARVAEDIAREKNKDSLAYNFDKTNFKNGEKWFDEGLSLDDAPENLRNNVSFIAGYEKAKRVHYVNEQVYATGVDYCDRNVPFEEIPEIYRNNEFFMQGYNSKNRKFLCK